MIIYCTLVQCYRDNNQPINGSVPDYPLCAVELKDFMFAAKDTPTCIRKSKVPNPTQSKDIVHQYQKL